MLILNLTNKGKTTGSIIIRAEQTKSCSSFIQLQLGANFKSNRMFGFGDTKGKLVMNRIMQNHQKVKLMETEWYRNTEPVYKIFELSIQKICLGDQDREVEIELWDHHHSKDDDFMGRGVFTLNQILRNQKQITLLNKSSKKIGEVNVLIANVIQKPQFIDYIRGNTQLNLTVAIDFTGSNGAHTNANSLHYIGHSGLNQYQQAIR